MAKSKTNCKEFLLICLNVPFHTHIGSTQNHSDQNKDAIQITICLHVCFDVG